MRSARATPRRAPTTRAQGGAARRRRPIASRPSRRAQERSRPPRRRARGDAHPSLAAVARLGPYRRRRAHDGSVEISEHAFSERLLRARTRSAACCAPVPCNLKMIVLFRALTHPQTHRLTGHPHRTAGRTPPAARGALAPGPAPGRGRGAGPQPLTPCAPRRAVTRRER